MASEAFSLFLSCCATTESLIEGTVIGGLAAEAILLAGSWALEKAIGSVEAERIPYAVVAADCSPRITWALGRNAWPSPHSCYCRNTSIQRKDWREGSAWLALMSKVLTTGYIRINYYRAPAR